jgi:hypothetical protein
MTKYLYTKIKKPSFGRLFFSVDFYSYFFFFSFPSVETGTLLPPDKIGSRRDHAQLSNRRKRLLKLRIKKSPVFD